jgi:hypothetical protein
MHTEQEKATRRARVGAAKDALERSATLDGAAVAQARSALRAYLRQLNEPRQPTDAAFQELVDAPFRERPQRRNW